MRSGSYLCLFRLEMNYCVILSLGLLRAVGKKSQKKRISNGNVFKKENFKKYFPAYLFFEGEMEIKTTHIYS